MNILCRLFGHRRDRRLITPYRESWQTECSLCSTRLRRVRHGHWVPVRVVAKFGGQLRASQTKGDPGSNPG
jgi:hypothetical protein